jgi:uncharacterized OsmC-like protein
LSNLKPRKGLDKESAGVEEAINDSGARFCSVAATLKPTAKISYSYEMKD